MSKASLRKQLVELDKSLTIKEAQQYHSGYMLDVRRQLADKVEEMYDMFDDIIYDLEGYDPLLSNMKVRWIDFHLGYDIYEQENNYCGETEFRIIRRKSGYMERGFEIARAAYRRIHILKGKV